MTRNGTVLHFSGPFTDRDGLRDLTAPVFKDARVLRPPNAALGSQVLQQLLLQRSTGLNEQASVNGFVDTRMLSSSGYWVSASRKSASATSPESVYSQRCSATSGWWKEGSAWAARPTAKLRRRPLDWLDTLAGHHAVRPPGSRSMPLALNICQSHASTNRKPAPGSARRRTAGAIPP